MVSRTTTLVLLTLLVMAAPATADDSPPENPSDESVELAFLGPCNIAYIRLTFPFVDLHPECVNLPP